MAVSIIFYVLLLTPPVLFLGLTYGDRKETGKWFWQKAKSGVNSGAKFG